MFVGAGMRDSALMAAASEHPAPGTICLRPLDSSPDGELDCTTFLGIALCTAVTSCRRCFMAWRRHEAKAPVPLGRRQLKGAAPASAPARMRWSPPRARPMASPEWMRQVNLYKENEAKARAAAERDTRRIREKHKEQKDRIAKHAKLEMEALYKQRKAAAYLKADGKQEQWHVQQEQQHNSPATVLVADPKGAVPFAAPSARSHGAAFSAPCRGAACVARGRQAGWNLWNRGSARAVCRWTSTVTWSTPRCATGTLVQCDDAYATDGTNDSDWYRCNRWRDMAAQIWITADPATDKIIIDSDGGQGPSMGQGNYNIVLRPTRPEALPQWWSDQPANVVPRPDLQTNNQHRYDTLDCVRNEARMAIFASLNGIGVPLYSVACFEGVNEARTLRYGSAHLMRRADMDLFRALSADRTRPLARKRRSLSWSFVQDALRRRLL